MLWPVEEKKEKTMVPNVNMCKLPIKKFEQEKQKD